MSSVSINGFCWSKVLRGFLAKASSAAQSSLRWVVTSRFRFQFANRFHAACARQRGRKCNILNCSEHLFFQLNHNKFIIFVVLEKCQRRASGARINIPTVLAILQPSQFYRVTCSAQLTTRNLSSCLFEVSRWKHPSALFCRHQQFIVLLSPAA